MRPREKRIKKLLNEIVEETYKWNPNYDLIDANKALIIKLLKTYNDE